MDNKGFQKLLEEALEKQEYPYSVDFTDKSGHIHYYVEFD